MPLLMLWGHGSFRTSNGYFIVPKNVQIEFFIDDNMTIDDGAMRFFEYGDLSQGVTDELIGRARAVQKTVGRVVRNAGDAVKNYKLESILGDVFASGAKNALKQPNVWTPGLETNNGDEETDLVTIVRDRAHLGSAADPLVIQWCACTSNYVGGDESGAPVGRGKKLKNSNASGSCCYISTATCSSLGLPDDCEPLNKLRLFRDRVLVERQGGADDVADYYRWAPAIVRAIDRDRSAGTIYREIYERHISPAVAAIDRGDNACAYEIYARMVVYLKRRFLR